MDELKRRIIELHDKYKPEAIFVTQTSGVLSGYSLKEAWKKAWPNEKAPKFLTIDARPITYFHKGSKQKIPADSPEYPIAKEVLYRHAVDWNRILDKGEKDLIEYKAELEPKKKEYANKKEYLDWQKDYIKKNPDKSWWLKGSEEKEIEKGIKEISNKERKYIGRYYKERKVSKKNRARVAKMIQEPYFTPNLHSSGIYNPNTKEFNSLKEEVKKKIGKSRINGNIAIIDECNGYVKEFDTNWITTPVYEPEMGKEYKRNSETLGAARSIVLGALKDLGQNNRVAVMGMGVEYGENERDEGGPFTRKGVKGVKEFGGETVVNYRRYSGQKERETARTRIQEFKNKGRNLGEQIYTELEKKRSLEQRLSAIIGISGLGASFLFLSSNLTGNVIANLTPSSSDIIGLSLFLIGLIGAFFYFKRKIFK